MSNKVTQGPESRSDNQLVAQIVQQGCEASSTELFHRYKKKIYIWAFNISHDREEAVDLTQEVFIRIFRGLNGYNQKSQFSTWVFSITRNHCLSAVGAKKERWRKKLTELDGADTEDLSFSRRLHEAQIAGDLEQLLKRAGRLMKEEELEAFILHFRDGLTVREITRVLDCTNPSGARTLIQNARRKFNRMIEGKERSSE